MYEETHLDRCQYHARVCMLELRHDSFTDMLAFPFVLRLVSRQCVQNGHASPLRTFIECDQELVQDGVGDGEEAC